jgi:hypothetical protein
MTALRRWVPVLSAMTLAMTFSSCVLRALGLTGEVDWNLVGLLFAVAVWLALVATRRWHGVRGEPTMIFPAVFVVAISFPGLLHGTPYLMLGFKKLLGSMTAMSLSMMIASAIGARVVAAGMSWATGRRDRLLLWSMVTWGAGWWPLHLPLSMSPLDRGSLLAWQLPVGLACAAWALRGPRQVVRVPAA